MKGKRIAIATGLLALAIVALTGFLLREDIRWWWKTRGVQQVKIEDGRLEGVASLSITSPAAVSRARDLTQIFLRSLPDAGDSHQYSLTRTFIRVSSTVLFLPDLDPDLWIENSACTLQYFELGEDEGFCVQTEDRVLNCKPTEWHEYLRQVIQPAVPELKAKMMDASAEDQCRMITARTLAWVAPRTEGVFDYLLQRNDWIGLGLMGPDAIAAIPMIFEAIEKEDFKVEAVEALARIGPPVQSIPILIRLFDECPENAARALGAIGLPASEAIPALESLRDHPEIGVRLAAEDALNKIRGTSR